MARFRASFKDLSMALRARQTKFDIAQFDTEMTRALKSALHGAPRTLVKSILYSATLPGKRIRPRLVFASAQACGLKTKDVLPFAIAVEWVHCFSLIHDDLPCMDDDDFRRGKPSNHRVFGEATALLAGDAMLSMALEQCQRLSQSAWRQTGTTALAYAAGPLGMIGGQALEGELSKKPSLKTLHKVHALKTGALFDVSVRTPALFAGKALSPKQRKALWSFSQSLGKAFQAADDLSDEKQDRSRDRTSILFYQSRAHVQATIASSLSKSDQELRNSFAHGKIRTLLGISESVRNQI